MFIIAVFLILLVSQLSQLRAAEQPYQGYIAAPVNGTAIAPGATFNFAYHARGDYCVSSFNYSVWLLTGPPEHAGSPWALNAAGHFFGRYASSTDGPGTLVMPDFSQYDGFATGMTASDARVHIAVVEEWGTCTPTFGFNLTMTSNHLIYNKTESKFTPGTQ